MKTLSGMLVYCMVQQPSDCYDKAKGKEYKCGIVVDEDTADEFNELYPKQAAKKVKRSDFEKEYKVAPPEGSEKNLYVITLKKPAHYKDKETGELKEIAEAYRPRVLQWIDGEKTDITDTILPANGSIGKLSIEHFSNDYGNIARLKNVRVDELIVFERQSASTGERGSEFEDEADDGNGGVVKVPAKAKTAAKPKKVAEEGSSDSDPF